MRGPIFRMKSTTILIYLHVDIFSKSVITLPMRFSDTLPVFNEYQQWFFLDWKPTLSCKPHFKKFDCDVTFYPTHTCKTENNGAFQYKDCLSWYGVFIRKMRRPWDGLIYILVIPILVRRHFYILNYAQLRCYNVTNILTIDFHNSNKLLKCFVNILPWLRNQIQNFPTTRCNLSHCSLKTWM